jgi:hypothetical protein
MVHLKILLVYNPLLHCDFVHGSSLGSAIRFTVLPYTYSFMIKKVMEFYGRGHTSPPLPNNIDNAKAPALIGQGHPLLKIYL